MHAFKKCKQMSPSGAKQSEAANSQPQGGASDKIKPTEKRYTREEIQAGRAPAQPSKR